MDIFDTKFNFSLHLSFCFNTEYGIISEIFERIISVVVQYFLSLIIFESIVILHGGLKIRRLIFYFSERLLYNYLF